MKLLPPLVLLPFLFFGLLLAAAGILEMQPVTLPSAFEKDGTGPAEVKLDDQSTATETCRVTEGGAH